MTLQALLEHHGIPAAEAEQRAAAYLAARHPIRKPYVGQGGPGVSHKPQILSANYVPTGSPIGERRGRSWQYPKGTDGAPDPWRVWYPDGSETQHPTQAAAIAAAAGPAE